MAADGSMVDAVHWSWGPGESRFALLSGGRVVELAVHRPGMLLGRVMDGRVIRVDPHLDAAFVDLGQPGEPGFLSGAKGLGLSEGMRLAVRVKAEAREGKGVKLARASSDEAAAPPLSALGGILARNPGITQVLVDDAGALSEARADFPAARLDADLDLDDLFQAALDPVVPLACGGRLIIEQTAALCAVDVDSGSARPAEANREAAEEIARQLRLRGIGGQVVVDFITGPKGTAYRMADALKRATALDPLVRVAGVSPLGLVELVRQRSGPSLAGLLCQRMTEASPDTIALSALRRLLRETTARRGVRLSLVLAPQVFAALSRWPEALAEAGRRLGRAPDARSQAGRAPDDVLIEEFQP